MTKRTCINDCDETRVEGQKLSLACFLRNDTP